MILDPGTKHSRLEGLLRKHRLRVRQGEFVTCLTLRRLFSDNVHRGAGLGTFADYVELKFGIAAKLVWTFSALGADLARLPRTCSSVHTDVGESR